MKGHTRIGSMVLAVASAYLTISAGIFTKRRASGGKNSTVSHNATHYKTLLDAVTADDLDGVLKFLAMKGGNVKVDAEKNSKGQTALMVAAAHGNSEIVQVLLAHHANPWLRDNDGLTALALAERTSNADEVIAQLREATESSDLSEYEDRFKKLSQ